jgi:hypothetical protein
MIGNPHMGRGAAQRQRRSIGAGACAAALSALQLRIGRASACRACSRDGGSTTANVRPIATALIQKGNRLSRGGPSRACSVVTFDAGLSQVTLHKISCILAVVLLARGLWITLIAHLRRPGALTPQDPRSQLAGTRRRGQLPNTLVLWFSGHSQSARPAIESTRPLLRAVPRTDASSRRAPRIPLQRCIYPPSLN